MKESQAKDTSVIPHGIYCYAKLLVLMGGRRVVPVNLCPYWKVDYCEFLEMSDDDLGGYGTLRDQCKECGENMDD